MSDSERKTEINIADDIGIYLLAIFLIVMCGGDPDLADVLQEWCRRYLEAKG